MDRILPQPERPNSAPSRLESARAAREPSPPADHEDHGAEAAVVDASTLSIEELNRIARLSFYGFTQPGPADRFECIEKYGSLADYELLREIGFGGPFGFQKDVAEENRCLLIHHLDNRYPHSHKTPLHHAIEQGDDTLVIRILRIGGNPNATSRYSAISQYDTTPLHVAAEMGDEDIAQILLSTGQVDVNSRDGDGETPLHAAVQCGQHNMVEFLLANGADRDIPNRDGKRAIYFLRFVDLKVPHEAIFGIKALLEDRDAEVAGPAE